ncbi:hypothetical protein GZH53_02670 [Flavihumibacter sp. R14]|nr:hypothetical protein [Flavihumibacter soli]
MKSQYPLLSASCLYTEPLDYLENFCGIRQVTKEFVQFLKSESGKIMEEDSDDAGQALNTEEGDNPASFFYTQTFTPSSED